MTPRLLAVLVAAAGVLVMAGGAFGYVKSGSIPSLLVAGVAGVLWIASAVGLTRRAGWAFTLAVVVALALIAGMAWRWAGGASTAVALPVIAISVSVLVALVTARRLGT